jgi:hypothetical protein
MGQLSSGILGIVTAAILAACTTTPPPPQQVWARKDGQRMVGNPELAAKGESDEIQCRTEAAQAAEAVNMPNSTTIGNHAVSGFGDARQAAIARMEACMDARGYRLIDLPAGETFIPT